MRAGPNHRLIGVAGSRRVLQTPCLVVEREALIANIEAAAAACASFGIALRPHAKTHKCAAIARLQLARGAHGICVATVGEAEALAACGIDDIHITSTFSQSGKIARVVSMLRSGTALRVVVDSLDVVGAFIDALDRESLCLPALIDIDMGRHRSGVGSGEAACSLAARMRGSALRLVGVQAYAGHLSHEADHARRVDGARAGAAQIAAILEALRAGGHGIDVVSGASTGTFFIDGESAHGFTELQAGSYVFMDVEYDEVDLDGLDGRPFEPALSVRTSVISATMPGIFTTDAGHKHFAAKRGEPKPRALPADSRYRPISDEHGCLETTARFGIGDSFECEVPHCDPTVNLFDEIHVVVNDTLVDIWPIEARGAY